MSTDAIDAMAAQFATDVLVFGAHPDDAELFCGGTVIRLVELGYCLGVVDLTQGGIVSLETPGQRAAEAHAASRMLGLRFRENLGLPDGSSGPAPLAKMIEVVRRRRPEIMLVPWIEERHPNHITHDPDGVITLLSSPRAIEACARFYGSMIGVSQGEPLRAPNALDLVDPVAHCRHDGFSEAHAFDGVR